MLDALYAFLRSLGFTHPLHAPIVHMPIGLIVGALLLFIGWIILRKDSLVVSARHVSIMALLFVFPTVLFGVFDWLHFYKGALIGPIRIKMVLAALVTVLLAAGIVLGGKVKARTPFMLAVYALTCLMVVGIGYLGATLVYGGWEPLAQPAGQAALSAQAQAGEKIFSANCQGCHPNGGNVMAEEFPLKKAQQLKSREGFIAFIRAPKMRDGSPGDMPAFPKEKLDDKQAADLFDYLNAMLASWK